MPLRTECLARTLIRLLDCVSVQACEFLMHFIEYALFKGVPPLYGARGEAMWRKMVLGHFEGLK